MSCSALSTWSYIYHMVEISMMAMMLNCVREHVYITKIVYASSALRVIMYILFLLSSDDTVYDNCVCACMYACTFHEAHSA